MFNAPHARAKSYVAWSHDPQTRNQIEPGIYTKRRVRKLHWPPWPPPAGTPSLRTGPRGPPLRSSCRPPGCRIGLRRDPGRPSGSSPPRARVASSCSPPLSGAPGPPHQQRARSVRGKDCSHNTTAKKCDGPFDSLVEPQRGRRRCRGGAGRRRCRGGAHEAAPPAAPCPPPPAGPAVAPRGRGPSGTASPPVG
eukprot:654728-Prorocentrum_minimum.AAC.2